MAKSIETNRTVPVFRILNENDSYPYSVPVGGTSKRTFQGISIDNNGATDMTVTIDTDPEQTIRVPTGYAYDGDYINFTEVDTSSGAKFTIELRSF